MKPKHILFPVDFSEHCSAAADYVHAMSQGAAAKLTLLHVMEFPPPWYGPTDSATLSALVDLSLVKESRQKELDSYLESRFHELKPLRLLAQGDPATEIVSFAQREDVSLIMMPTRGRGPFRRYLIGSVTAKVLHDAACPVWSASHSEHVISPSYPYRRLICAIDLTSRGIEVLHWASQLAAEHNAELSVVHAVAVNEESLNPGVMKVREYLCSNAHQEWQHLKAKAGIEAPFFVACGSVGAAVRKAAHDLKADAVVIGRGRLHETLGRLRSNCYAIIRESPCPVISV